MVIFRLVMVLGTGALLGACSGAGALDNVPAAPNFLQQPTGSLPSPIQAPLAGSPEEAGEVAGRKAWQAVVSEAIRESRARTAPKVEPLRNRPVKLASLSSSLPKGGGYRKIGKPYVIKGVTYVPRHEPDYEETGIASWYGDDFHGKKTANGETYDMHALTAAHRTLPLPSLVNVTNVKNGKTVMVRVNDRGPFKKGRIIDVSSEVAKALGFAHHGLAEVRVKYLGPAPLNGDDSREKAHLAPIE